MLSGPGPILANLIVMILWCLDNTRPTAILQSIPCMSLRATGDDHVDYRSGADVYGTGRAQIGAG